MNTTVKVNSLPTGVLRGAALLVGFSLLAVFAGRALNLLSATAKPALPVRVMHLSFVDRTDGGIEVHDADHGDAMIHLVPPGTNGFMRGVLRGMARARRNEHVGESPPFTLTRWNDGQMTLTDPQTGRHISLEVFGPTNAIPFAQLLTDEKEP